MPESKRLAQLETVIEEGLATFVAVGNALIEINENRLYRQSHKTFEHYVLDRWNMTARHAYRQIEGAKVVKSLPEKCVQLVTNESQVRALAKAPEKERAKLLTDLDERDVEITASSIKQAAELDSKTKSEPFNKDRLRNDLASVFHEDAESLFRSWDNKLANVPLTDLSLDALMKLDEEIFTFINRVEDIRDEVAKALKSKSPP